MEKYFIRIERKTGYITGISNYKNTPVDTEIYYYIEVPEMNIEKYTTNKQIVDGKIVEILENESAIVKLPIEEVVEAPTEQEIIQAEMLLNQMQLIEQMNAIEMANAEILLNSIGGM